MEILKSLNLPQNIYDSIIDANDNKIVKTKFHNESLLEHLLACADNCVLLSKLFGVNFQLAYWCGFLHDIGKPFAMKNYERKGRTDKKQFFIGHAQLGSYLINRLIFPENLGLSASQFQSLLFVVDNHMCCLSHSSKNNEKDLKFLGAKLGTHLFKLGLPNGSQSEREEAIRLSFLLFTCDELSRISETEIDQKSLIETNFEMMNYFLKNLVIENSERISPILNIKKIDNDKIIILPLGISETGKSTFSKKIKETFSDKYEVAIVERDDCYYEVYENNINKFNNTDHKFDGIKDSTKSPCDLERSNVKYQMVYQILKNDNLSDKVQELWINKLNNALDSSAQIIIIDTVQTLYEKAWSESVKALSEDARESYYNSLKVAMYLFPQKQLGVDFYHKCVDYQTETNKYHYPLSSFTFPDINLERGGSDNDIIDIGTGVESQVINIINNYMTKMELPKIEQVGMLDLIKKYGGLKEALKTFPKGLIFTTREFENKNIELTTITYEDGMQNFKLETRDYRGETILYDKNTKEYFLARGSLPIFPDYNSIEKDVLTFPYIKGHEHLFNNEKLSRKIRNSNIEVIPDGKYELVLTPKYDGSLMNITFINKTSKIFNLLNDNLPSGDIEKTKIIRTKDGLFIIGSKNRFIALPPVDITFLRCMNGVIGCMSNLIYNLTMRYIINPKETENITFHFEAIGDNLNNFLTVYYDDFRPKLLGYTIFNEGGNKNFKLPNPKYIELMINVNIKSFDDFEQLFEYINKKEHELLEGSSEVEPEGYVIHIFDHNNAVWLPIKYKHDFYYMAHKPYSKRYVSKIDEFRSDKKYELLRQRLLKFRNKKPLKDFVEEIIDNFDIINKINSLIEGKEFPTKKDWVLFWQSKKNELDDISKIFITSTKEFYPDFKIKILNIIYTLFEIEINKNNLLNKIL